MFIFNFLMISVYNNMLYVVSCNVSYFRGENYMIQNANNFCLEQFIIDYAKKEMTDFKNFRKFLKQLSVHSNSSSPAIYQTLPFLTQKKITIQLHPFSTPSYGVSALHQHDYFEIGYLFRGCAATIYNKKKTMLKQGDLFICNLVQLRNVNRELKNI